MANGNDVAPAVRMMDATPVTWHLGNGRTIDGRYKAPDMSHIPRETEHLFATNSGDIFSADDLKTLSEKVEAALREKEEKKRNLGEPKRPY